MVVLVVGVDIMVGAHGILLPSGLVVWEWYAPRCLLSLLTDVACVLLLGTHAPSNRYFCPRRCMIRVRDHLMWKGCDPCHDFRV